MRSGLWSRTCSTPRAGGVCRGRAADPSVVMVDAKTVRGGRAGPTFHEPGGRGGRTIGAKRIILVEILGLPLAVRADSAKPRDVRSGRDLPSSVLVSYRTFRRLSRTAATKSWGIWQRDDK